MTRKQLVKLLEAKGYWDRCDETGVSLFEYGVIRNPSNNHTIYCCKDPRGRLFFDWGIVRIDDVKEALDQVEEDFFEGIFTSRDEYLKELYPDDLASSIHDINSHNSYFNENCDWDYTLNTVEELIDSPIPYKTYPDSLYIW